MDFLTRLAQRVTGDLPAVQPRLPQLYEPAAGHPRVVEESGVKAISGGREPEKLPAPLLSTQLAPAASTTSARRDTPSGLDPLRQPVRMPALAEPSPHPAPTRLALEVVGEFSGDPSHDSMARAISQLTAQLVPPRRGVPVTVRPAAARTGAPPLSTISRRSTASPEVHDQAQPRQVATANERTQGPATVHVHIGRVDVRAVMTPAAPARPAPPPTAPRATLEDYLSGRKGGSQP
jgi:hypothetical protein